jgi:hypothetical protein
MLCKRYVTKTIKTNYLNCENEFEAAIKDINRNNNAKENLEVLYPNCHC